MHRPVAWPGEWKRHGPDEPAAVDGGAAVRGSMPAAVIEATDVAIAALVIGSPRPSCSGCGATGFRALDVLLVGRVEHLLDRDAVLEVRRMLLRRFAHDSRT